MLQSLLTGEIMFQEIDITHDGAHGHEHHEHKPTPWAGLSVILLEEDSTTEYTMSYESIICRIKLLKDMYILQSTGLAEDAASTIRTQKHFVLDTLFVPADSIISSTLPAHKALYDKYEEIKDSNYISGRKLLNENTFIVAKPLALTKLSTKPHVCDSCSYFASKNVSISPPAFGTSPTPPTTKAATLIGRFSPVLKGSTFSEHDHDHKHEPFKAPTTVAADSGIGYK